MSSLHPRQPFTPQRSPSMPSSQASQSPPTSDGECAARQGQTLDGWVPNQGDGGPTCSSDGQEVAGSGSGGNGGNGEGSSEVNHVLHCWTAHQSHGQATILFYVPRWTKKEDLQIVFGSDYIVAGVRQEKEMVVQARLAGRINMATSTWQLERRSKKRTRSRSRTGGGIKSAVTAGIEGADGKASSQHSSGESSGGGGMVPDDNPRERLKRAGAEAGKGARVLERTSSPASSSETSSFDLLGHSTDTLESGGEWDPRWNHSHERSPSPHWPRASSSSPTSLSPRPLDQSITLSEESGYIPSGSNSGAEGVRSLESSISIDASHGGSSGSRATRSEDDVITDAKLVTLHLDKLDGGIWPFMVSGPASLSSLLLPTWSPRNGQQSLDVALSEALAGGKEEQEEREEGQEGLDASFAHSTTTIDTISSDDSTTVLGGRGAGADTTSGGDDDEQLYEMDPTSLALMGIRHAKQGHRSPFASTSTQQESQAFQYFKRAWRRAEIPLATTRLVEDYLPLDTNHTSPTTNSDPIRSRLTAALGGPTALARLYVSYARLFLPSSQDKQSPLAFPLGGLSNPFGRRRDQSDHLSQSPPHTHTLLTQEAMPYLRAARNLDKNVLISETEWQESQSLERFLEADRVEEERGSASALGGSGSTASQGRRSPSKRHKHGQKKKKDSRARGKREEGLKRGGEKYSSHHHSSDQGLVFILVSRAALLSVVVAGGVAVAGWWRRAAATGGGSG